MYSLKKSLSEKSQFALGVELVTTRGTIAARQAVRTRSFATQLVHSELIDWVSITDNAGGNPQLSPMALGKPILYAGKEVLIHLSCKDFNRHGLESEAWQLASEGFRNILALSGDYPAQGFGGQAKPVFDIDSVGLLSMLGKMNRGSLQSSTTKASHAASTTETDFFVGAVATNFKRHENEVVPQLLKMKKKIACGAQFIIAQIGYDARKSHEMLSYLQQQPETRQTPLIGNVFVLSKSTVQFFRKQTIPGVVITDSLAAECESQVRSSDRGAAFFHELAAKQLAIFRGMGFAGGYLGGVHSIDVLHRVLEIEDSFASDDWKQFAREIQYSVPGEYYLYAQDPDTKLADPARCSESLNSVSKSTRKKTARLETLIFRFSKLVHDTVFSPNKRLYRWARRIYQSATNQRQGPKPLRIIETGTKSLLFGCKDCGDCSLPDIAFLCPESQCAKNQRNGPCGGTRDGLCEVEDFECIWSRAYDRLKGAGQEHLLLGHAPVVQDEALRGSSSWANALLGRDHAANDNSSHIDGLRTEKASDDSVPASPTIPDGQVLPITPAKGPPLDATASTHN